MNHTVEINVRNANTVLECTPTSLPFLRKLWERIKKRPRMMVFVPYDSVTCVTIREVANDEE